MQNQKGSLSITSLWALAILSLLSIGLARNAIVGLRVDGYSQSAQQAAWIARAGIYHAMAILQQDAPTDSSKMTDSFADVWADNREAFMRIPCGDGLFEIACGREDASGATSYFYGLQDENSRININKVPEAVLKNLPGMTFEKLAALLDWLDRNEKVRPGGAERDHYRRLEVPYECKNAPIDFFEELTLIEGISAEDIKAWRPLITLFGNGSVNINTTSATVLNILGIPMELAVKIIGYRDGKDGIPATEDDHIFQNADDITLTLADNIKLKPEEQIFINGLASELLLGVQSSHFRILSVGLSHHSQARFTVEAIVDRSDPAAMKIVSWREGL